MGFRAWLYNKESSELVTKSDFFRTCKIMYFNSHFMRSYEIMLLKNVHHSAIKTKCSQIQRNKRKKC